MPRFNGMGPCGMGARTGRGMGPCSKDSYGGRFYGSGYRRGRGRFRGLTPHLFGPEEERTFLEDEKAYLEARLEEIDTVLEKADEK